MNRYLIEERDGYAVSYLIDENDRAISIRADKVNTDISTGCICTGRVMRIVPSIKAAFIEYAPGKNGYLPLDAIGPEGSGIIYTKKGASTNLQQSDEMLFTVVREAIGTKLPGLSHGIELAGQYCVLTFDGKPNGVSSKIEGERRSSLKAFADKMTDPLNPDGIHSIIDRCGFEHKPSLIMRTNAQDASADDIVRDIVRLKKEFDHLWQKAQFIKAPAIIGGKIEKWLERMRDISYTETEKIIIENQKYYENARDFLRQNIPDLSGKLEQYQDPLQNMRSHYSLDRQLKEATQTHVWLNSGAFLVIEHTEALTAIDVNTGKNTALMKRADKEDKVLKTNMEAAREIARQMRLRNLSGMILVDFINMQKENSIETLLMYMRSLLSQDPNPGRVVDMTKLGLVEITRKKTEPPLDSLHFL